MMGKAFKLYHNLNFTLRKGFQSTERNSTSDVLGGET